MEWIFLVCTYFNYLEDKKGGQIHVMVVSVSKNNIIIIINIIKLHSANHDTVIQTKLLSRTFYFYVIHCISFCYQFLWLDS